MPNSPLPNSPLKDPLYQQMPTYGVFDHGQPLPIYSTLQKALDHYVTSKKPDWDQRTKLHLFNNAPSVFPIIKTMPDHKLSEDARRYGEIFLKINWSNLSKDDHGRIEQLIELAHRHMKNPPNDIHTEFNPHSDGFYMAPVPAHMMNPQRKTSRASQENKQNKQNKQNNRTNQTNNQTNRANQENNQSSICNNFGLFAAKVGAVAIAATAVYLAKQSL